MDYTVGSLSDLISGSNTPNKKKVIKKEIKAKSVFAVPEESPKKNKKKQKKIVMEVQDDEPKPKKAKKERKSSEVDSETVPKKKKVKKSKTVAPTDSSEESPITETNEAVESSENTQKRDRKRGKKNTKKPKQEEIEEPEVLSRTIFVGNVPINAKKEHFKRFFSKYGVVDSFRFRGAPVKDPKTTKKVAVIKKEFHPDRKSWTGYVKFMSREEAINALQANGEVFKEHHLRVQLCNVKEKPSENKSIFVGNLSFGAEDEQLWNAFAACGAIESVRVIRDPRTGMGKGFGYVNFQESDAAQLALELEDVKINDKILRISPCNLAAAKKNKKSNFAKKISTPGKPKKFENRKFGKGPRPNKSFDGNTEQSSDSPKPSSEGNTRKRKHSETDNAVSAVKDASFQGSKVGDKKKKKFDKGAQQKKNMAKKVAPRS